MVRRAVQLMLVVALLSLPHISAAGVIKAYYTGFAVTGAEDRDEVRSGLKALLASKMANALVIAVDAPAEADIVISGDYLQFGTVFSIDAIARNRAGVLLGRAFVQGDGKAELLPAVDKLAQELTQQLRTMPAPLPPQTAPAAEHK